MFRLRVFLFFCAVVVLCVPCLCAAGIDIRLLPARDAVSSAQASFALTPVADTLLVGSEVPIYWTFTFTGTNASTWLAGLYLIDVTTWTVATALNDNVALTAQAGQYVWNATAAGLDLSHTFQFYIADTETRAWTYGNTFNFTTEVNMEFLAPTWNAVFTPSSRVAIRWTGGYSQWDVQLFLVDVTEWTVAAVVNEVPIPNLTQTVLYTLPAALSCKHVYQFYVENSPATTWTYGPQWTIQC